MTVFVTFDGGHTVDAFVYLGGTRPRAAELPKRGQRYVPTSIERARVDAYVRRWLAEAERLAGAVDRVVVLDIRAIAEGPTDYVELLNRAALSDPAKAALLSEFIAARPTRDEIAVLATEAAGGYSPTPAQVDALEAFFAALREADPAVRD